MCVAALSSPAAILSIHIHLMVFDEQQQHLWEAGMIIPSHDLLLLLHQHHFNMTNKKQMHRLA